MFKRLASIVSVFAVAIAVSLSTTAAEDIQVNVDELNHSLSGTVMDVITEEKLSEVEITLEGEDKTATSNEEGEYSFENLEPGTYTLNVSHDGYQEYSQTVEIVDGDVEQEIRLQPMQ